MKKSRFLTLMPVLVILLLIVCILLDPAACRAGAAEGLALCGRVVIPSLFPFTACILFLSKCGLPDHLRVLSPVTRRVFGLSGGQFALVFFSFLGGYPIGAKLLDAAVRQKRISPQNAGRMLYYSVNAGPAFVVLAIGQGLLGSRAAGYLLLSAHIAAAILIALAVRFFLEKESDTMPETTSRQNAADCFVAAVSDAADALLHICAYVIFFSTVLAYVQGLATVFPLAENLCYVLEVTCAVGMTRNLPLIAFLLGFGGLSVWCQVFSVGKAIAIRPFFFALARLAHGLLSALLATLLLKIFNLSLPAAATTGTSFSFFCNGPALSLSMAAMTVLLLLSLFSENRSGNLLHDLL